MKHIEIGFGAAPQRLEIPDQNLAGVLLPNQVAVAERGEGAVRKALGTPVDSPLLRHLVRPGEKVAIITSDITRPLPSYKVLPAVLEELWAAGCCPGDVTVVFALGIHRKHTSEEMEKLVGPAVYGQVRCVDSSAGDFVRLGVTKNGTPVDVARVVAEADRRIALGNIEYHYFAGYSGGAKAIMPGVSTREAIKANHSKMILPEAAAGRLEGNPVRMDIEEALNFCPLDFIVNVVLDEHKEIIFAATGHPVKAHRAGAAFLDTLYRVAIPARADIVVASQGGAPKDLNLYQTQKALDNAKHAVKDGGVIILVGSCREGLGEDVFEQWLTSEPSADSMIERIQKDFQLGGHKAAAIALVLQKSDVYLVSDMDSTFVQKIFLKPFTTVQAALDAALAAQGAKAQVLVMPYAGSTLPWVQQ
jgi:nickel-dependent lactate racemase